MDQDAFPGLGWREVPRCERGNSELSTADPGYPCRPAVPAPSSRRLVSGLLQIPGFDGSPSSIIQEGNGERVPIFTGKVRLGGHWWGYRVGEKVGFYQRFLESAERVFFLAFGSFLVAASHDPDDSPLHHWFFCGFNLSWLTRASIPDGTPSRWVASFSWGERGQMCRAPDSSITYSCSAYLFCEHPCHTSWRSG